MNDWFSVSCRYDEDQFAYHLCIEAKKYNQDLQACEVYISPEAITRELFLQCTLRDLACQVNLALPWIPVDELYSSLLSQIERAVNSHLYEEPNE